MKKVPFFLPFGACQGRCVYCDQRSITGRADLPPVEEVRSALRQLPEPAEVCFFGGSFCRFPFDLVKEYLDAVRECAPTGSRIRLSTYPTDLNDPQMLALVSSYPIACVELGVPTLDPAVLQACKRGADTAAICAALALLRDCGLPVGVQMMIGLPGQTVRSSMEDLRTLAEIKGRQVWDLRLYPCLVIRGTELETMMRQGAYRPLSVEQAVLWGGEFLERAAAYGFRPIRTGLQETDSLARETCGGPHHPALGELILAEAIARKLAADAPKGPWHIPNCDRSKFTGHGRFGMQRLSVHTGIDLDQIGALLHFF